MPSPIHFVLYLSGGAALGMVYFSLLYRTVGLLAAQAPMARVVPLYLLRVATALAVFWFLAQRGAVPLLLGLLGFLIVRLLVQYRIGVR